METLKCFLFCVLVGSLHAVPLKDLTNKIYIGTALNHDFMNDSLYLKVIAREFNTITPENALKWPITEPQPGQYDYSFADDIVEFAQKNKQQIRGHAFIWHRAIPDWASTVNVTVLRESLMKKIVYELTRYKGKMSCWDVVNEVFTINGTLRTDNIFYQNFGEAYIIQAFKLARKIDPSVKLYINDYAMESINEKSNGVYEFVKRLIKEGVPIDGVGFQGHLNIGPTVPDLYKDILFPLKPKEFEQNLKRFIDLGIEVAVTELDVGTYDPVDASFYEQQAQDYADVYRICKSFKKCIGVTAWNWSDKYSYAPHRNSDIWDINLVAKPALKSVQRVLRTKNHPVY